MKSALIILVVVLASTLGVSPAIEARPQSVSMVQLLANPAKYHNMRVQVVGYLHLKFEDNGIYLSKNDADHLNAKNGFWVDFAKNVRRGVAHKSKAKPKSNRFFDCRMVLIEGRFNMKKHGHLGAWSGTIEEVNVVLEQTRWFDGKKKLIKP